MQNFTYSRPTKLIFGKDNIQNVGEEVKKYTNKKILLTTGGGSIKKNGLYDIIIKSLNDNKIDFIELSGIKPNPETDTADKGAKLIKDNDIDFILAVGGGSVLDNSKHMAIASKSELTSWELLMNPNEVAKLKNLPKIGAVITVAATGSEMNEGGVLSNPEINEKRGMFHSETTPVFTFEDPTILYSLPIKQKRAGVSDILSHLCEVYFGNHEDEGFSDRIVEGLMLNTIDFFQDYINGTDNYDSHANIFLTSTYALNGITRLGRSSQDWTSHSIEHYVSAYTDITHGIGLAVIHPKVLRFYYEKDVKEGNSLRKFVNLGRNVFHIHGEEDVIAAEKCVEELEKLFYNAGNIKVFDENIKSKFDEEVVIEKIIKNKEFGSYLSFNEEELRQVIDNCFE